MILDIYAVCCNARCRIFIVIPSSSS